MKKFLLFGLALCVGLFIFFGTKFFAAKEEKDISFGNPAGSETEFSQDVQEVLRDEIKIPKESRTEQENEIGAVDENIAKNDTSIIQSEICDPKKKQSDEILQPPAEYFPPEQETQNAFDELAKKIIMTSAVEEQSGEMVFSYEQPEIPKEYHVSLMLEIFDENEALEEIYFSDEGWVNDASAYDPSAGKYSHVLGIDDLKDKAYTLTVRVSDATLSKNVCFYKMLRDYDGTITYKNI